ncbi:putative F-box domain-containing protein [Helianthus annuus]|nr:putative F-box domain-containing protein [Helianthus annuus]KAJ0784642.1 putative F-box domain-containing protein [Helianthus annuus]KAJ0793893.1 putative F-box domain-containing protein [Helianthus annuus]
METQEEEEEQHSTMTVDSLASLPSEIIQEILFRLPIKSILRFKSLSKQWLSRISDPSFTKLHLNRATAHHRLFFSFLDYNTCKRYFFSAAQDGGPVTHLMTLHDPFATDLIDAEHLNGLVFITCTEWDFRKSYQFVFNPTTHQVFELPDPPLASLTHVHIRYLFGFDESRNEHKILMIRQLHEPTKFEVMVFSLTNYSWRKIDAEPPVGFGFTFERLPYEIHSSVCVNSVIHLVPSESFDILMFDLRTEKFSMIGPPRGVVPHQPSMVYTWKGWTYVKSNKPCLIKINGRIGVICHERLVESNEMHIWILQDYENRVWVREIFKFPLPWIESEYLPYPLEVVNTDGIILSSSKVSGNEICLQICNKKSRRFKSLRFTMGDQFLLPRTMLVKQIKCYVESIVPLRSNR